VSEREGEEYTICTRFCAAKLATTSPVQIAGSHTACSRVGSVNITKASGSTHAGEIARYTRMNRSLRPKALATERISVLPPARRIVMFESRMFWTALRSSSVTVVLITSTRRILSIARSFFLSTPAERTAVKIGLV
jgi:hypothetical protein